MTRRFVLVTTSITGTLGKTATASGIRRLKRGVAVPQFIVEHLSTIGVHHDDTDIHKRDNTWTVVLKVPAASLCETLAMSWNFTEFEEEELVSMVAHLTKDELTRDLRELLPLRVDQ